MNPQPTHVLADSNLLVYAINSSSPKNETVQAYLRANAGSLAVAHQNIFESFRVLTHAKFAHPMPPLVAIKAINAIVGSFRIISPDYTTHQIALELIRKHSLNGDEAFDAYLAATCLSAGIAYIATDNVKDFAQFERLTVINPF